MKDPRLIEIEFLSALERERPSSIVPWEWQKKLDVSQEFFRAMVFGLFADRSLDGTSAISAPQGIQVREVTAPPDDFGNWGVAAANKSVRKLLSGDTFGAHINHAGRVRLWRLRDEILRARIKDSLCGLLWDKRHWNADLTMRLAMSEASTPSVVIFIDVDGFKSVNDRISHLVGDEILRIVFQVVLDAVGEVGEVYRWGGDEISALLPTATLELGQRIGESIRTLVEEQCGAHHELTEAGLKTTVSVGVVAFTGRPSPDAITDQVDRLTRKAKDSGKNRVLSETLVFAS